MRFLLLAGLLCLTACVGSVEVASSAPPAKPSPSKVPPTAEETRVNPVAAAEVLAQRLRPAAFVSPEPSIALAAQAPAPRPVVTLRQMSERVDNDSELAAAVEALELSGLDRAQISAMLTMAAAYNSGTAADPVTSRHAVANRRFTASLASLESALGRAEQANAMKVDRVHLVQRMYSPEQPFPEGK